MDYTNNSNEQIEIEGIEDEAAILEMMLTAHCTENQFGFYDYNNNLIDFWKHQYHDQQINNLKNTETPTWHECYPCDKQPIEELESFPPYRPIDFIAPAASPPRTSFLPSPKAPKFSYIPEPRLTVVAKSCETSAGRTLITLVSSSDRHSSKRAAVYGGGPEARGNGNYQPNRI